MGKKTLKIKVGGDTVRVTPTGEETELEKLDREVQRIEAVFKCLSKIDESVNAFDEEGIGISLQCPKFCPLANKEFCQDVVSLMSKELTRKMSLKTRVDTFGFVDFTKPSDMSEDYDSKWDTIRVAKFWIVLVIIAIILTILGVLL